MVSAVMAPPEPPSCSTSFLWQLHAIVRDSARRGEVVYKTNCMLCHGVQGDGNGRAGRLSHPPPADLTRSEKDDRYKIAISRGGGAAMGRSSGMPPWGQNLTEAEMIDVVRYLGTLLKASPTIKSTHVVKSPG
jgi:cytochrome c oxidase cbb3-type subunit III